MFPRLQASREERVAIVAILLKYLSDTSKIVKTCAMQALAELAEQDATLRQGAIRVLEEQPSYAEPGKKAVAAAGHCEYSVRDLPGAR